MLNFNFNISNLKGIIMKKQILLLTGLLALANSAFAAETTPALTLNSLTKEIKDIANQSIVVKAKEFLPAAETSDFLKLIDNDNFKNLTKPELLNIQAASLALQNAYNNATQKLQNLLSSSATIQKKTVDTLIDVLVSLYKGESYADAIKNKPFGFTEGPAGKILALVANASNLVQNLQARFTEIKLLPEVLLPANIRHGGIITTTSKSLLPAIKKTEGTSFIAQDETAKQFIAYAIGRLVIYKSEIMTTLPVVPDKEPNIDFNEDISRTAKITNIK